MARRKRHMRDQPPAGKQNRSMATSRGSPRWRSLAAFAAVYVTWGALTTPSARRSEPVQPAWAPKGVGRPIRPGRQSALSQGQMAAFVFRKAPEALPEIRLLRTATARRARWPTGAARSCCSTCGRPGACPAARRCRRSTGCRRRWAPTSSRWWPWASTARAPRARKFLDRPRSRTSRSTPTAPPARAPR